MEKAPQNTVDPKLAQDDFKDSEMDQTQDISVEPTAVWSAKEERRVRLKYVLSSGRDEEAKN